MSAWTLPSGRRTKTRTHRQELGKVVKQCSVKIVKQIGIERTVVQPVAPLLGLPVGSQRQLRRFGVQARVSAPLAVSLRPLLFLASLVLSDFSLPMLTEVGWWKRGAADRRDRVAWWSCERRGGS